MSFAYLGLECWVDGLCHGVLVGETYDVSVNGCLEECQENDDCFWLTHDSVGDICLMFEDCQELDAECDTCVSSQRQCSEQEEPDRTGQYNRSTCGKTITYLQYEKSNGNLSTFIHKLIQNTPLVRKKHEKSLSSCMMNGFC